MMAQTASLRKIDCSVIGRAYNWISKDICNDINLTSKIYSKARDVRGISHWAMDPTPGKWREFKFSDVFNEVFEKVNIGFKFGPLWSTHWFKVEIEIPLEWKDEEIHFIWDSGSEVLVYNENGDIIQGLTSHYEGKSFVSLNETVSVNTEKPIILFLEVACNDLFGGVSGGLIGPPDKNETYSIKRADISVFNPEMFKLAMDMDLLINMSKNLDESSIRKYESMFAANEMANLFDKGDFKAASETAERFFSTQGSFNGHVIAAMGHCHIDTAWLWPIHETIRKCARSWSSVILLLEKYPKMIFTCSQAQQFEWIQTYFPSLFDKISSKVFENRFIPTGGTWVEMDTNIPSGESFVRQFLYGQTFFQKHFNILCHEFWLPDTFGYSPQLPQIMKMFEIHYFLTQKLSWSLVNKFPHHNFLWKGIDGTSVLAHFPPGESYEMKCKPEELLKTVKNLTDKGRVDVSCFLYGFGDGGGGPSKDMLERLERLQDCDGLPKVKHMTPTEMFAQLEKSSHKLMTWDGELYLELHNATYTTQAKNKMYNRLCEFGMQYTELLVSLLAINHGSEEMILNLKSQLDYCWKKILTNQFHDIIPGTSIQLVHEDSIKDYKEVIQIYNDIADQCLGQLIIKPDAGDLSSWCVANGCCWSRNEVLALKSNDVFGSTSLTQTSPTGAVYAMIKADAMGITEAKANPCKHPASIVAVDESFAMSNGLIFAIIDKYGRVVSLKVGGDDREAALEGQPMNQFTIFEDKPFFWDAWDLLDIHLETKQPVNCEGSPHYGVCMKDTGPLVASVDWTMKFGEASFIEQSIVLKADSPYLEFHTSITWKENRRFLKVEFPLNIRSTRATYEIQFGHMCRNMTTNTSWDWAQYEVFGHKWADVSEFDFGVSVLNDSKYGWSAINNVLALSLLKAPKNPDPTCDMGQHTFKYAVMPHIGSFQMANVIQRSYEFNHPLRMVGGSLQKDMVNLVGSVDKKSVILETIKPGEKQPARTVVLRLYESFGGSCCARITLRFAIKKAFLCSGLEEPRTEIDVSNGSLDVFFKPFQVQSILCQL